MSIAEPTNGRFVFSSSVAADTWHPQKDPKAYEWWYFDALSDDASEALVIVFLDNFIYSPRYNRDNVSKLSVFRERFYRFPAVSFTYYADGKRLYKAEVEYPSEEFRAREDVPTCRIGKNEFRLEAAPYGNAYVLSLDLPLSRGRRLRGELEWLSIESDFGTTPFCQDETAHCWNMVAPRSDVTGRITIEDEAGHRIDTRSFRGTGYHDHNLDNRWLAKTVKEWHWGRAHFNDLTAVFCQYSETQDEAETDRLFLVRGGELIERAVRCEAKDYLRDKFGIRYPTGVTISAEDEVRLTVTPMKVIDSSFYHLRFLSSFELSGLDGRVRVADGVTEFIAPRALRYRWLDWLSDLRTGHDGKAPRF